MLSPVRFALTCLWPLVVLSTSIGDSRPRTEDSKGNWLPRSPGSSETSSRRPTLSARHIALSGTKHILPFVRNDDHFYTQLQFTNITDSEAEFSFTIRGADGLPLAMRFAPVTGLTGGVHRIESDRAVSGSEWITVPPHNQLLATSDFDGDNAVGTGWMDFTSKPDASIIVTGYILQRRTRTSVGSLAMIIEPTETYRRASVPVFDLLSELDHELVLINPSATGYQTLKVTFRNPAYETSCNASVRIPPMGQTVLEVSDALPCSATSFAGSMAIQAQAGFSGLVITPSWPYGTIISRLVGQQPPTDPYFALEYWTVASGQISFGNVNYSHCLTLSNSPILGLSHTVHSSKWQTRTNENARWSDVPNTDRIGQICPYSPTPAGEYRGVAEISVDGVRGMFASSNALTVDDDQPSFSVDILDQSYVAGEAISALTLPAGRGGNGSLTYSPFPPCARLSLQHHDAQSHWHADHGRYVHHDLHRDGC